MLVVDHSSCYSRQVKMGEAGTAQELGNNDHAAELYKQVR
jgi:hypothetical protein